MKNRKDILKELKQWMNVRNYQWNIDKDGVVEYWVQDHWEVFALSLQEAFEKIRGD